MRSAAITVVIVVAFVGALFAQPGAKKAAPPQPESAGAPWPWPEKLAMMQRSVLPAVSGRIDHMAMDPKSNTLFVAAVGNGTLEVMDVGGSAIRQSLELPEPQGVVFIVEQRRLVVACGGDGCRVFAVSDAGALTPERTVKFGGGADNLRYDSGSKRVLVGHGESLGSFDPATGEKGADVKLPGAPEGFVAEPGGGRVFVNLPKAGKVAVIDREQNAVTAEWELPEGARGNYAMAMDVEKQRLFVACRKPARLFVLDAATGKSVASLECAGDADDVWFDAGATKRVFVVGGAGSGEVTAIKQEGADSYSADFKVKTAPGARTGVLVPEMRKLIVAAPNSGDDPGYVFFYLIAP